jgi:hypothetical protein
MATLQAPSSQKAGVRPISFLLDDQSAGVGPPQAFVDLVIRPEELVRTDPSRAVVHQTLGGAFIDNFGPGIAQITISGHTGWRRTAAEQADGLERFQRLKNQVYDEWHAARQRAVWNGVNPDAVRLIFADALDEFAAVVVPMSFTLRRNKQRPLLQQYQLSMLVVAEEPLQVIEGELPGADERELAGLDSLTASIDELTRNIHSVRSWVDSTLVGPVQSFMGQTARLYGSVRGAISAGTDLADSVINAARLSAAAGINLFRTVAAVASIPQQAKAGLMAISSAYSNIYCVLRNALRQKLYYQDYSDLYGASNCSSTAGGRPLSMLGGENPFYKVVPTAGPSALSLSQPAQNALQTLAGSDPVLSPLDTSSLAAAAGSIADGMVIL